MRLIDADAFADFIKNVIKAKKYDALKVNGDTLTVEDVLESIIAELDGTSLDGFKNNPTIEPQHYHEENLLAYAHDMGVTLEQAEKELTMVSQIAPQRIKGRWLRKESDLSWWYECSECGESPLFDPYENEVRTPFCPWCGAEMQDEQE